MPVIEAQCASILVPHDHRHINHVSKAWAVHDGLKLLAGALRHGSDLWLQPRGGSGLAPPFTVLACVTAGLP